MSEYHKPDLHVVKESPKEIGEIKYKEIVAKNSDPRAFNDLAGDLSDADNDDAKEALSDENQWIVELPPENGKRVWGLTDLGLAERARKTKARIAMAPMLEAAKKKNIQNLIDRGNIGRQPLSSEKTKIVRVDAKSKTRKK